MIRQIAGLLDGDEALGQRLDRLFRFSRKVRSSEYHLTNACNLRCKGCWFFEYDYDRKTKDEPSLDRLRAFARRERDEKGISAALLIGGEPTLVPDRVAVWVETVPFVTISTNGLRPLPVLGFEEVCVAITLFGGGSLDDELRAIKPNGTTFEGLFDTCLANYEGDPRAVFIYAVTHEGIGHIEETVRRVRDNGNRLGFNYYAGHGLLDPLRRAKRSEALLDELLRVKALYPETVGTDDLYLRALITGRAPWGEFGYEVCPSVSQDHPAHEARLRNGNPVLPGFNVYAPDLETVHFCCTSGHCGDCRDSQAVYSWLLMSFRHCLGSKETLARWVQMAEDYWSGFIWSPYHPAPRMRSKATTARAEGPRAEEP